MGNDIFCDWVTSDLHVPFAPFIQSHPQKYVEKNQIIDLHVYSTRMKKKIDFNALHAVIWDMDGVLVDSEPAHLEAWRITLEKHHLPSYPERLKRTFGMTSEMVVQTMIDEPISAEKLSAILQEKDCVFKEKIMQQAPMPQGVMSWLSTFKTNNIRQAVASSGTPENIQLILHKLDILSFFDEIVSGKGIPSKPAPNIFLKAADLLGVIPPNCLVIEDSRAGVQAARAAGMRCVAVTTTSPPEQLDGADIKVENLSQLMTDQVLGLFSG